MRSNKGRPLAPSVDDEDQFHASRDKILLDGDDLDSDDEADEDEVFGLKGMEEGESEGGGEDEEAYDFDDAEEEPSKQRSSKKKKRTKKVASSSEDESESEEETWGRSKSAYYSSNAAQLDTDDEEANELEEQEATRLQAKAREEMGDEDFGVNDVLDVVRRCDDAADFGPSYSEEHVSVVIQPLPQDRKALVFHLEKNSPETLALARDWEDTAWSLTRTREKIAKLEAENAEELGLGMIHLHYQALLTYATTLAFYLYLRSSEKYVRRPDLLKSHPILSRLLTLKQSLSTLEDLDTPMSDSDTDDEDDDELEMLYEGEFEGESQLSHSNTTSTRRSKLVDETPPQKRRKTTATEEPQPARPIFDLVEPIFRSSQRSNPAQPDALLSDAYGEVTSLHHADAVDKSARKKSLRFHTSKIESARTRRQGAKSNAVGGDDDIPYKERRKEKEAKAARVADTKTRRQRGDDLDDEEPELATITKLNGYEDGEAGVEAYYDLVKKNSKARKETMKAEYEAAQAASRLDFNAADTTDGPRSLTRTILANKGLTPHRPKSVRNPRVKKRQKFEQTKKKISSQKAVYKGGIGDMGRYEGEKSGITKVVKSIKLG